MMCFSPLNAIAFQFGAQSLEKHCRAGQRSGCAVLVRTVPTVALDVDVPEDLPFAAGLLPSGADRGEDD
jgi:2-phospho-L-lactate guanylyltransferase (CobY/MobA/RfbA family)